MIKNSLFSVLKPLQHFQKGQQLSSTDYILQIQNKKYFRDFSSQHFLHSQISHQLTIRVETHYSSMDKKKQQNNKKGGVVANNAKEDKSKTTTSNVPASIYEKGGKFFISIHAKPNSKVSQLTGTTSTLKHELQFYQICKIDITDEGIDVNIAAPPKDGEANAELIDFISQTLGIKKSSLSLDKGGKSRNKLMEISDSGYADVEELYQALKDSIS